MVNNRLFRSVRYLTIVLLTLALLVVALPSQAAQVFTRTTPAASNTSLSNAPSAVRTTQAFLADQTYTPVGPGVQLVQFNRFDARGLARGQILIVDLNNPLVSVDLLHPGSVAAAEPLSTMVARSGAIAAVNGDFFDIYHTNAPYGAEISKGAMLKSPVYNWPHVAGVGFDRLGRVAYMGLDGAVNLPSGEYPLNGLNHHILDENGIGLFTTAWGGANRGRAVTHANGTPIREVVVTNGTVVSSSENAGEGWIPPDSFVLLGREAGADILGSLNPGDPVSTRYGPRTDAPVPFDFAIGGREILIRDGQTPPLDNGQSEPRTAIGFSADGQRMFLVTVDGRRRDTRGLTLLELSDLLRSFGAHHAMNLDGGGSTTMLARKAGEWGPELINRPAGGAERYIPNGIGIFVPPGSGQLTGIRVVPILGEGANRVFPGLSRTLVAKGFDETYAPAGAYSVSWQSLAPEFGFMESDGVFRAGQTGTAFIQAQNPGWDGVKTSDPQPIHVLGPLTHMDVNPPIIEFRPGDGPTYFALNGYDPNGESATIEPRDVTLEYDTGMLDIVPADTKHFQITPKTDRGITFVKMHVGGITHVMPVSIGIVAIPLSQFDSIEGWSFNGWNSEGGIAQIPSLDGQGLLLTYDFAQSTEPRRASAVLENPMDLQGWPIQMGAWVHSDGQGQHVVFTLRSADGNVFDVYGPRATWTEWQFVEVDLPQEAPRPLQLVGIGVIEDDPGKQYTGQVVFDGLGIKATIP
ncbi:MAG: 3',5'-cyclic AMP phosphodiesterase CpdA [Chloroflexi bacterium AL-W]|nr:3',5'-cyclic AMP phosphodiesterase CpdA [Chloroflexi bacterium AL-N1]NOK67029.1 3',5'-cyclic AMP phosphodiesterase CpdA [Chloroflexi bacterium AL-N10]NOK74679.1 3',5'-cyclic AMP phosphodiesterase CpdA [Chloroflexi bacterium AL-N5]NOK81631.1 3',5'-cyclic AMP phosphodiesterase CpdA [Chloroflexi bacterium AL-W]NOK89101.1 3',5'-cyclic AMP phosphodiesterase CpdA [Chloroflexi bacterium AL-N15]